MIQCPECAKLKIPLIDCRECEKIAIKTASEENQKAATLLNIVIKTYNSKSGIDNSDPLPVIIA